MTSSDAGKLTSADKLPSSPGGAYCHAQTALVRQIIAADHQIDALVYALYSLTPDEIKIVEQATQ